MTYNTDERLKSYLDTNQMKREQMCLAILAIDKRFSEVNPRHPRGGPDGGRDIEAIFKDDLKTFGAIGFVNQANDSSSQKKNIKSKFSKDLEKAISSDPPPKVLIFFTNINLTTKEKDNLVIKGLQSGLTHCEIFDRERLRISLDNPDGFHIRFQYLDIPLSEAEQASFFTKWGDDIQSVIATGFKRIEEGINRLLFLQESANYLRYVQLSIELDRNYSGDEIGHFRDFCTMHLFPPKENLFGILWGASDKSNRIRMKDDVKFVNVTDNPGIKYGIGRGQWENYLNETRKNNEGPSKSSDKDEPRYEIVECGSSIGRDSITILSIVYKHTNLLRMPVLNLKDIDGAFFILHINESLAKKVKCIHIYANGYKLQEISSEEFRIDTEERTIHIPVEFSDEELEDKWVRIRPYESSAFIVSFSDQTPRRLFSSPLAPDSLAHAVKRVGTK